LFKDILHQELALKTLKSHLAEHKVAHAYLFFGPESVGKKLTALNFAKALNCENSENAPCDKCSSCQKIDRDTHPDVKWIFPSGPKRIISIEKAKDIKNSSFLKSFSAPYKVFIVDQPERMNQEAGNSFLKTLEEPPPQVVIILISAYPERILPTLISRCQKIKFAPLPPSTTIKIIGDKFTLEPEKARLLYSFSQGNLARINLWNEASIWEVRDGVLDLLSSLPTNDYQILIDQTEEITGQVHSFEDKLKKASEKELNTWKDNLPSAQFKKIKQEKKEEIDSKIKEMIGEILFIVKTYYQDLWALREGSKSIVNTDREDILKSKAIDLSPELLLQQVAEIEKIENYTKRNANLSLSLQVLFINLNHRNLNN